MSDRATDSAISEENTRHAVCVHTQKIMDSCLDKDCIEDLRVYLTRDSQAALDKASGAKARCCELIHAAIDVEPIPYNSGNFTVDITFFYRITGDITTSGLRSCALCGLAVFSKRVVLCGGSGGAKSFSSRNHKVTCDSILHSNLPEAIVEVLDPMILAVKVMEACEHRQCEPATPDIPHSILECFGDEIVFTGEAKRLFVTIGQFSTIRLERDAQLQVAGCRHCIPTKACCDDPGCAEEPCDIFSKISFPTDAFFPTDACCDSCEGTDA